MGGNFRLPCNSLCHVLRRSCVVAQQAVVNARLGKTGDERRGDGVDQDEAIIQIKMTPLGNVIVRAMNIEPEAANGRQAAAMP